MSKGPTPLEWCTDYHCAGDCGLRGHGVQHKSNDESAAEMAERSCGQGCNGCEECTDEDEDAA